VGDDAAKPHFKRSSALAAPIPACSYDEGRARALQQIMKPAGVSQLRAALQCVQLLRGAVFKSDSADSQTGGCTQQRNAAPHSASPIAALILMHRA